MPVSIVGEVGCGAAYFPCVVEGLHILRNLSAGGQRCEQNNEGCRRPHDDGIV
jgi:hypothetical protein